MTAQPTAPPADPAAGADPVCTDSALYSVVLENERVRVLRYRDRPGDRTTEHGHPDMVMVPLCDFRRRLTAAGHSVEFDKAAFEPAWVPAQAHIGENTGDTDTHVLLIELK